MLVPLLYCFKFVMLLNAAVIYCLATVAGCSNGDQDCSKFTLTVEDILGIEQSLK